MATRFWLLRTLGGNLCTCVTLSIGCHPVSLLPEAIGVPDVEGGGLRQRMLLMTRVHLNRAPPAEQDEALSSAANAVPSIQNEKFSLARSGTQMRSHS
ncbi:hypothetical protein CpipJ_CPIJ006037 [Culex quinquefasciatus]|uniref:Secreted protein n=1 Tax=Culex quinquefasciatus TaxID=7176 RepID=B0WFG7_CULQU|nr:hypothetical protein CpipJ_CPIJ006037 [Culex quinquefasciatus]|eukprot:XP_001847451.1 hypothetical protein CpipJ_CPIJ006037 [Culex quinquefasciatus]